MSISKRFIMVLCSLSGSEFGDRFEQFSKFCQMTLHLKRSPLRNSRTQSSRWEVFTKLRARGEVLSTDWSLVSSIGEVGEPGIQTNHWQHTTLRSPAFVTEERTASSHPMVSNLVWRSREMNNQPSFSSGLRDPQRRPTNLHLTPFG